MSAQSYRPVVIIGAGRSGTNILRDVLTSLPVFGTWPCDEINYIWRHGNMRYPTDEFTREMAGPSVQSFVRRSFDRIQRSQRVSYVVEKTCANSLRVGFVDQIVPDAVYIFIVRDGRDVVASAMKRWTAELDIPYLMKKARYVPVGDLPYYGVRYFSNRVHRARSNESRLASWGPRFEGIDVMLAERSLAEVCAVQWKRCVERSAEAFAAIDPARICTVRYEDFVADPAQEIQRVTKFLSFDLSLQKAEAITANVAATSVGKWRQDLSSDELEQILPIVKGTLVSHDYH